MSLIINILLHHVVATTKQFNSFIQQTNDFLELSALTQSLRYSIRNAGFTPCTNLKNLIVGNKRSFPVLQYEANKNLLHLQRMDTNFDTIIDTLDDSNIVITKYNKFFINNKILIADCKHAEINSISHIKQFAQNLQVTLKNPLQYTYETPGYIGLWIDESFYLKSINNIKVWLYYKKQHAERLSSLIKSWSINFNNSIINIHLLLNNNKFFELITRNRQF